MILFFDIDGTLLSTTGCGMAAMQEAGKRCFGAGFTLEGVSVAGRLDPLILADAFAQSGVELTEANLARIREEYARCLATKLDAAHEAAALPGVYDLLKELAPAASSGEIVLALLTGNFEETARMKLERCGIDPDQFAFGVYGDHAETKPPRREDLVPVGVRRAMEVAGRPFASEHIVIIGDTPHDVSCAKEHGGRCLAVATGRSSEQELAAAGADWTQPNLLATREIVRWLVTAARD